MRYAKYTKRINKKQDKYSVEHTSITFDTDTQPINGVYQQAQVIVPSVGTQGMRKVKHVTVNLTANTSIIYWALVYVPQGYTPNTLNPTAGLSLYEPNQNVMTCGIIDPDAGPTRIRSPVSRNLNSGDAVYLVVGSVSAGQTIRGVVTYAITLQ